jgi:hypothetical protein
MGLRWDGVKSALIGLVGEKVAVEAVEGGVMSDAGSPCSILRVLRVRADASRVPADVVCLLSGCTEGMVEDPLLVFGFTRTSDLSWLTVALRNVLARGTPFLGESNLDGAAALTRRCVPRAATADIRVVLLGVSMFLATGLAGVPMRLGTPPMGFEGVAPFSPDVLEFNDNVRSAAFASSTF